MRGRCTAMGAIRIVTLVSRDFLAVATADPRRRRGPFGSPASACSSRQRQDHRTENRDHFAQHDLYRS
jgi:hypothetical protein